MIFIGFRVEDLELLVSWISVHFQVSPWVWVFLDVEANNKTSCVKVQNAWKKGVRVFLFEFFFKPLFYHKRLLCKFFMNFFSHPWCLTLCWKANKENKERKRFTSWEHLFTNSYTNSSQSQESCVKMNFVELDGVTIMQRIVAFEIGYIFLG